MSFTLAIVGRPNVGKSTLFNRLVGKKLALVDDQPGVTRDLREGPARLGDLRFTVIDTAGLEEATDQSLQGRMRRLTERAVEMADVCLFMYDARTGIMPADEVFADILRKKNANVILAANKSEGKAADAGVIEGFNLGLGEPIRLSAEHGEGFRRNMLMRTANDGPRIPTKAKPLQIAVVGRPNAGKSTLINQILGEDRLLTGPEAGITRDAISVQMDWGGTPVRIFDTAGMRKRAKVQEKLEKLSVSDGLRAVKFAEVVVVLLDVEIPFEQQDLRIADLAEREGRAVVLAVNKWDVEGEKQAKLKELKEQFERLLPQLRGAPLITVSAKTGRGVDRLQEAILRAHEVWNPPCDDRSVEPLVDGYDRGTSAPCTGWAAHQVALYDPSENAPAGVCCHVQPPRKPARKLFALSGERVAVGF
ncbi:GTPase Der [Nymphon striatum]|nr:GTPase Der [Nymphon striatum]